TKMLRLENSRRIWRRDSGETSRTRIAIVAITMRIEIDAHIVDTLMRDLVSHDRAPSAFLLYLYLWRQTRGAGRDLYGASLQEMASDTGLSKSSVQNALRRLKRRGLVSSRRTAPTSASFYQVHEPWRRGGR